MFTRNGSIMGDCSRAGKWFDPRGVRRFPVKVNVSWSKMNDDDELLCL